MTQQIPVRKGWIAAALMAAVIVAPSEGRADVVTDWNVIALQAHAAAGLNAVRRTRVLAMVHAAVHDALNAIDRRAEPYAFDMRAVETASAEAAVASAAYTVLSALVPSQQSALDGAYAASLSAVPAGPAKDDGIAVGALAARTSCAFGKTTVPTRLYPTRPEMTPATGGRRRPPSRRRCSRNGDK